MMTKQCQGTTALGTGADRGIGRAVALGLPDAGDTVAVLAGSAEPPDQAAALLPATSGTALTVTADLADTATPGRADAGRQVSDELGPVDLRAASRCLTRPAKAVARSGSQRYALTRPSPTTTPNTAR